MPGEAELRLRERLARLRSLPLLGGAKLNGKAALVDVKRGAGHVVLFGFRPQYRGQSLATYPLVWGAMR